MERKDVCVMRRKRLCTCGNPMPSRKEILRNWFSRNPEDRYSLTCKFCKKRYVPTVAQRVLLFFLTFAFCTAFVLLLHDKSRILQALAMPMILVPYTAPYVLLPWQEASAKHPPNPKKEFWGGLAVTVAALLCTIAVYLSIF